MLNGRCTMGLVHDITFSFRLLWKNRGFAAAAILILALAIGANSTIFTLVNSILLRQLPFGNSDGLVWIWSTRTDRDKAFFSIPNLDLCRPGKGRKRISSRNSRKVRVARPVVCA